MHNPAMAPFGSKLMRMNLPKREEFAFIPVFALPKASSTGLDCRMASAWMSNAGEIGELGSGYTAGRQPRGMVQYAAAGLP